MFKKYMEKGLISLGMREMQIKAKMGYHYIPIRMTIFQRIGITNV